MSDLERIVYALLGLSVMLVFSGLTLLLMGDYLKHGLRTARMSERQVLLGGTGLGLTAMCGAALLQVAANS